MKVLLAILCFFTLLLAENYTWKIAVFAPEKSPWMLAMKKLAESVEKESGGKLILQFYPGGVAGTDQDVLDKMKKGILQGAGVTSDGLGVILPEIRVLECPFLFSSYAEFDSALETMSDHFKEKLAQKGYVLLGWTDQGFVYLMSQKQIDSPSALSQTHSWVWKNDPLALALSEAFQNHYIASEPQDVLLALQKGSVDTIYMTPLATLFLQWYMHTKYFLDMPVANAIGGMIVSKAEFDTLPENLQQLLRKKAAYYTKQMVKNTRDLNEKATLVFKKKGIQFLIPSLEAKKEFQEKGIQAAKSLTGKLYSLELLEKIAKK
ncbi:MAG: TRAP transporter substrate-binding protein DctP [Candidatus Brocadiae bacterium]|nr:TRAP transporter substrate-binding protein DctP [Candidatus Brocadiia bacterium]